MAENDKPAEETDEQVLQKGFGVPEDYESPALEDFGGEGALPVAHKPVPPTPAEKKYMLAPQSGGEMEHFEAVRSELQKNFEHRIRGANSGKTDEEVSREALLEIDRFRFSPPYRAPDTDLQERLKQGVIPAVIGRRVIQKKAAAGGEHPIEQMNTIEQMMLERNRLTAKYGEMKFYEALGAAIKGTVPTQTTREVNAAGLFLTDDPRATDEQLGWGARIGAAVGGVTGYSTAAAKVAAAAARGAPAGPWGIAGSVAGQVILGSAVGYFGTGIAYSYDQDDFWEPVEAFRGLGDDDPQDFSSHRMLVPTGMQQLAVRGWNMLGAYDAASAIMGLGSNWTEEDRGRFDRIREQSDPGTNFNALVDLRRKLHRVESGEVEGDEEDIKQLEAAYMNTYLGLSVADVPKKLLDDYRVEVERAIRSIWSDKPATWARRQAERMTQVSAQKLRNLYSARPLIEDRQDIPGLYRAIAMLKAGADDADVEQMLRTIPFGHLMQIGLLVSELNVAGKKFQAPIVPLSKQHMMIVAQNVDESMELQKATGADASKTMARAFSEMMLTRVEDEYGQFNYVESNVGRAMRVMMGAQELFLELPIPYITPAGIDRAYGLGIRAAGSGYWDNVFGAIGSGTGGLTMNSMMMMQRAGWDRESAAYKWALFLSVGADFLVPWEEASIYLPYTAGRAAWRMASIPRRVMPTAGVSKGGVAAAVGAPSAYRLYHKLVYGKDKAPDFSDVYDTSNHVIDAMIREAFYKGDAHKGKIPKLIESQMKLLMEKLGVEGGYEAVKAMAMRVSEDTFGSTLSSIQDIIENGTATHRGLRSTPGYKSAVRQIKKMVEAGNLKKDGAALYMALLEIQAVRFSQDPNLPQFKSSEDYFNKIQHLVGGEPGPNAKFSGIHPEVRNVGAETLGKVHGERLGDVDDAPPAKESLSFMHTMDIHSILRLGEGLGIEVDSPGFQSKLEELGFAELPLHSQADIATVYSAMQRGYFGGDPRKLPRAVDPKFEKSPLDYDDAAVGPITADMDLGELERAFIGSEMEHGAWVDTLSGKQVGRRRGEVSHVPLTANDYIRSSLHRNLTFTHVHPTGGAPSPGDIVGAMASDSASMRAMSALDDSGFVLDRPEGEAGWGPEWNLAERVRDKGAVDGWREFISSGIVDRMDAALGEARDVGFIQAIYLYADDILAATGSAQRADRFREVALEYFKGIIEGRGYKPSGLEKYLSGETAYDAEAFKQRISERVVENYEEALEEAGINARIRRTSAGKASKPGLREQSDIGAISRELEGYTQEFAGARGRIAKAPDAEAIQKDLFGKKPKPEAEAPEPVATEALTEPVAEAIADIVEAPGGIGIDPAGVSAALKAGGEVSAGELAVDRSRILDLLGQQMYAGSVAEVAIKELTQNSWDAVKRATVDGEIQPGEAWIDVEINRDDWSITVKDNGKGMTADTVQEAFFTIGGTDKGINPDLYSDSGGLGMAKIQFLFSSKRVELTTVRNGVKTTVDTVPAVIKEEGGKFDLRQEATSEPNGTTVKITLPRELLQRGGEVKDVTLPDHWFGSSFLGRPLIGDVEIRQRLVQEDGSLLEQSDFKISENNAGHAFNLDGATPFWSTATFDWGTADIYMAVERSSAPKIEVLSSGLYQFDWYHTMSGDHAWAAPGVPHGQAKMLKKALPYKLIVDIKPTVKATDSSYPFNNQREGFRPGIEEDIKALGAYLIGHGRGIEAEATAMVFEQTISMERVDLDDMFAEIEGRAPRAPRFLTKRTAGGLAREIPKEFEVGGGKIRVGGKVFLTEEEVKNVYRAAASFKAGAEAKKASAFFDTTKVDPSKPLFHNNTNLEIPESAQPMLAKLGTVVLEFKERLAALYGYEILNQPDVIYAAGISLDKEYQGVHVRVPYRAFFLNPLSNVGRKLDGVVGAWFNTLIHEGAHTNIKGHVTEEAGADFAGEMGVLYAKLADSGDARVIQESLERILDEHWDEYDALRSSYERSTTRNVASSMESEDQLPAIKDERLRPGVLGTRGEDVGPEGRPIERVERGPGEGGVFEPEPGGATVIEALYSNLVAARGVEAGAPAAAKLPDPSMSPEHPRSVTKVENNSLRHQVFVKRNDPRWQEGGEIVSVGGSRFPADHYLASQEIIQPNLAAIPDFKASGSKQVYHETSLRSLKDILMGAEAPGPRQALIWVSDDIDLALGQGGNKYLLEFDPRLVNGEMPSNLKNQGLRETNQKGREYKIHKTLHGSVRAITVPNKRGVQSLKAMANRGGSEGNLGKALLNRFDFDNITETARGLKIPRKKQRLLDIGARGVEAGAPAAAKLPDNTKDIVKRLDERSAEVRRLHTPADASKEELLRSTLARLDTKLDGFKLTEAELAIVKQQRRDVTDTFEAMGKIQRAGPESAGARIRFALKDLKLSPDPYGQIVEDVGDLTHRMGHFAYDPIRKKVKDSLRGFRDWSGLDSVHSDNVSSNELLRYAFKQAKEHGGYTGSYESFVDALRAAGQEYADAHRTVPVYNELHRLANDAAIALGEFRFKDARKHLEKLEGYLDEGSDAFTVRASRVEPEFARPGAVAEPPAPAPERIGLTYLERAHDGNYRTVHVDPRKFDADWAKDTDYYVPSEGRNPHSEQKYQRFLDFARSGKPVEVPLATFTDNPDKPLSFTDGRHRFAVLRDQGVDAIPVQVPAADAPTFAARYGVEPGTMKPDVDNRGPTRLLAGLNGAPGEMPEVGLRHARYRTLLGELKKLQDDVIAKQGGKYTEVQEASRGSIHTEIDRLLTEVYNIFKPDLHKVLSTNAHPDDIKLASVRGPDLDEGGLPGWGGEPGHPFVQLDLSGDLDIIRGRLAQFSKAYEQESLVLREPVGASDLPPGYLDDISAPFKGDIPEPLLFRGADGETRAATMRIELNEAIMARAEFEQFLRVAELERAGISVIRQGDVIELVYVPELAKQPVSPGEFLSIARHAAASLSDFAETKNLGPVAVGHIRENIHVSAPEGGQVHGEYTVRGYDDVIGEGLNAEELRKSARTNADLGAEAGARGARRAKLEEQRREDSDASAPGRSTNSERLPDPTPARQSAVVRELTSELGVHLDREGGKPHARVGEVVKERLEQSGLSKAAIEEATKRLQPDNASPLKSVSKKVELELALSDDPGAAPRKLEFEVKLVRTDASTAFVPGGLEGTFSFPDLDYVTRRPILLDPKLDLSEIKALPSKEAARLRRTYKGMGLPEQLINDALGFSLPDEIVYTASDIAGALRAAGEAYEDLTVALYRKHLSSMGTAQHRPAAPKAGEALSQDYIDRLNVHAMDQLGIIIMAMTSAGTNITENQLLASAIRPRTRQQLRDVANMIRDGRARKTRWYEERSEKIKRYSFDELQGQDLDVLSEQYIEVGLPRDAAEQLVGRGEMPYSEKELARFLNDAKASHADFSREEAQYLLGMAITAGSASEAKYIPKGLLGQVRGGGFRKWWEPGSPFQEWEWDAVRNLNEHSYQQARDTVIGKIQKLEAELNVLRAELDIDRGLLKTEKGKARKTSIRRRIKQQEEAVVRKDTEYASLRAFLTESAGEFIPGAPVPRLTEGFVSRSQVDPRFIANLIADFEADLARVESGKQQYLWYERHPDETFDSFIMRIQSSAKGMGTKTSSFALALTDPLNADVAAIDVHMIRKYWRKIVPDAKNRLQDWYKSWQQGRGAIDPGGGAPAKVIQARGDVDFKTYFKDYSSDWVQRVQGLLAPRPVKVQPRGIEIDVAARKKELKMARASLRAGRTAGVDVRKMDKLARNVESKEALLRIQQAVSKWDKLYPDHPALQAIKDGEARVATDAYERAVKILRDDPVAKDEGLSTFGAQWMRWDQIRRYYEPEMTAAPGSSAIPGQSAAALMELRRELVELHFFRNPGKSLKDPGVRMYSHTPGSAPRIAYYGGPEKPGGSFEIDAKTGEMMIRMYETGDIGVLFHENGHLIDALLGAQWKEELFSHYPTKVYPELIEQDVIAGLALWEFPGRRLAPGASEQMAEAWKWFIMTRVGPGGPARRKFMELYRAMQDWWLRTRNQPEVLPGQMKELFDMYFRPTDVALEGVIGLNAAAWEGRFPRVNLDADMGRRISEGKVGEAQQKMGWEAIDLKEEHIRQAMNIPKDLEDIDVVDLFARSYAYVATEQIRKEAGPMDIVNLTRRSHVPVNRLKRIRTMVRDKMIYYMQVSPEELSKKIIIEVRDGKEFEVFELGEAEAAGFKRLVEDMAGEPMGNIIYARMLEPDYDYSRPTDMEYNVAIEVMKDVVAGAGARRTGYSVKVSSNLGYAVWNMFRYAANNLSDDKSIAVVKKTRNWIKKVFYVEHDVSHLDPIAQTLTRSWIRKIADAPDWARRRSMAVAETLRADPMYANAPAKEMQIHTRILDDLRESLEWPVHPSKVWLEESKSSPLLDMYAKFKELHRVEKNRKWRWDKENPDKFPNAERYADFTTEELFADLGQIKLLLREEGQFLTEPLAKAIDTLEIYKKRLRTTPLEDLNEFQQFELGGAIDEIHYALGAKIDSVSDRVSDLASSITGSEASGLHGALSTEQRMQLYNWFFTGQFEKMIDFVSNRGYHTGLEAKRMSKLDMSEVMLEMIIRMKAQQAFNGLLEELTRYNLRFDVRDLDTAKEFGPNFDRTAYAARVMHYLKSQIGGDRSIRAMWKDGKRVATEMPNAPQAADYPVRDRIPGPTGEQNRLHDMRAYFKAMEIIDRWGIGTFAGAWETFKFPDGTETILPVEAINALQMAIDRAAGVGSSYGRTSWAKTFLPERKGLPVKDRQVLDGLERKGHVIAWSALSKALNWLFQMNPATASRIKMGITTGLVIPILPYYVSVGIGAQFQMYQGLGIKALRAMARNPRQVMAVVARLWKDGGYRPDAPAIVTKDGRIYTMDRAAEMAQRYSLNQSFISVETAGAVADDIAKMTPKGTLNKIMSGFSRWQDTLIESATAIDNYFRVATFIDALKAGESPESAAALARKVGFDYSELSEFERNTCRNTILFYSYMRKNQDLFWDTLLTHPSRVIGQLRLIRGINQVNLEEDQEVILPDHLKSRLAVYFRDAFEQEHINRQVMWMAPPLPVGDAINLYVDIFGTIDSLTSPFPDTEPIRGLTSRLTPWVQAVGVYTFDEDIFFERALDKYNRVPAWFVEADYLLNGGMLGVDVLDITDDPMYDPMTEEFPGHGFYHARNGKYWWVFRRLLQTPGFGRSMDVWESVDRSNIGGMEYAMEAARAYRMWGVREGFLEPPRRGDYTPPSELGGIDPQLGVPALAGPRRHYDLSGPEEFSAVLGFRGVPVVNEDIQWVRLLRRQHHYMTDQLEKEKKGDIRKRR